MSDKNSEKDRKILNSDIPESLKKHDKKLIENITFYLKSKYNLDNGQLRELITKKQAKITIPVSIFNKRLSSLETIVKFLKEEYNLSFKQISKLLNRSYTTITNTYKNSLKKHPYKLTVKDTKHSIPVSILKNRKFSVLETITSYLKDSLNLKFSQIAILLKRNTKTVWTVYKRRKKKDE